MVNRYDLPQLQKAYMDSLAYASSAVYTHHQPQIEYLITWPKTIYADQFRRDTDLLHESLTSLPYSNDVASQVFGNQLRQDKISAKHLAHLLYERAALYSRHVSDIDHRHIQLQEALSCEKLNSPHEATRRQMALERLLLDLESDRRKAELDFWKDTREIREVLFDKAQGYQATRHRLDLLEGLGGDDGQL